MVTEQLSIVGLKTSVKRLLEEGLTVKIFDAVPKNYQEPFLQIAPVTVAPVKNKTMHRSVFNVPIRVFLPPSENKSSVAHDTLTSEVLEVLSKEVEVPHPYECWNQRITGMSDPVPFDDRFTQTVINLELDVLSGFKMKL